MIFCNLKTVRDLNEVFAKICSKRNPKPPESFLSWSPLLVDPLLTSMSWTVIGPDVSLIASSPAHGPHASGSRVRGSGRRGGGGGGSVESAKGVMLCLKCPRVKSCLWVLL